MMVVNGFKNRLSKPFEGEKRTVGLGYSVPHPNPEYSGAAIDFPGDIPDSFTSWPLFIPIVPEERLQALVFHHIIPSMLSGELHCWTYISQGMEYVNQKEVVFTVRRKLGQEQEGDYPKDPLRWFELIYSMAKSGHPVNTFERTDFESSVFLGRPDIAWIVYAPACPINTIPMEYFPENWLQAIPLIGPEAEVAGKYGVMRALSHLGATERWFPWPPWFDRDRTACIRPANMNGSIKDQVTYQDIMQRLSIVKKGFNFILYIPEDAESQLVETLGRYEPGLTFPLNSVHHEDADSGLLWSNGDTQPQGYAAGSSNRCMNLNHFAFRPNQERDELMLIEDGYVFLLTDTTWFEIRKGIEKSKPSCTLLSSGERFYTEYCRRPRTDTVAENENVRSPPNPRFTTSVPPRNLSTTHSKPFHVHCDHIILLDNNITFQDDIAKVTSYIKGIETVMDKKIPRSMPSGAEGGGEMIIEVEVGGSNPLGNKKLSLNYSAPGLEMLPLVEIYDSVIKVEPPSIRPRTRFRIVFNIWGYTSS